MTDHENRKFSYSAGQMYQTCPRKYWLHYVKKLPKDTDVEDDALALRFGTAYHSVLESTAHDSALFTVELLKKIAFDNSLEDADTVKLYACLMAYYRLHAASKLQIVGCELPIGNEQFIGYVDCVFTDVNGNWWICDLKTTGIAVEQTLSRLHKDVQLSFYAAWKDQIAEKLKLDPIKFAGVRYRTVLKPKIVPKPNESMGVYAARAFDRKGTPTASCEIYDVAIPADQLNPHEAMHTLTHLYTMAHALTETTSTCNRGQCFSYFKPCPYFSYCHEKTYTECSQGVKFYTMFDMCDQTLAPKLIEDLL